MPAAQARRRPRSARICARCASASGLVVALEDRARVGHRLVEEQPVEVVAQVVVGLDVAAAAGPGVPPQPVRDVRRAPQRQPPPVRPASRAPRGCSAADPQQRRRGRGSTTARPCTPRRPRRRRRAACARRLSVSWTWISPDIADDGSPKTRREPSGRTTTSRPTRIRSAAPSMTRPARRAATSRARAERRGRVVERSRRAIGVVSAGRRTAAPVAEERGAAQPQAKRVPVDQRRWSAGSAADGGRASAAADRSLRGTRRRTRLVLSSGAPSWRSAIESAGRRRRRGRRPSSGRRCR